MGLIVAIAGALLFHLRVRCNLAAINMSCVGHNDQVPARPLGNRSILDSGCLHMDGAVPIVAAQG